MIKEAERNEERPRAAWGKDSLNAQMRVTQGRTNTFWGHNVQGFIWLTNAISVGRLFGGWGRDEVSRCVLWVTSSLTKGKNRSHVETPGLLFFLMWTIFKVFIEFVTILFMFYVLVWGPCGMWDLSSPTRHWTHTPCSGRQSLKIAGPPGKFLHSFITRFTKNKWEPPLMAPSPTLRLLLFLETWTLSHKVVG